jgi:pimeloyl-ACP methyl ester carboxylesterase
MMESGTTQNHIRPAPSGNHARASLLATMPVSERRFDLAGISTAVLEGGDGPPLILLHGPGEHAAKWFTIVPELARSWRVVAPDLPGHGESVVPNGAIGADRVVDWLDALIRETCDRPPAVVGQIVGGAIAARFASRYGSRLRHLLLCDSLGLAAFSPAPVFGRALAEYVARPGEATHDGLWQHCALDLPRLRARLGRNWDLLRSYNIDRARTADLGATQESLMAQFGLPAIEPADLERIAVATTLVWGRDDRATALAVAEAASERYGWPLRIIDDCGDDPPIEQPAAFLQVVRQTLGRG